MTPRVRVVFDVNVLISALLFKDSVPRQSVDKALEFGEILLSLPLLDELNDVLGRDKFKRYITDAERIRFVAALVRQSTLIDVHVQLKVCRDPRDDKFLELGIEGQADYLVSGDDDLLSLNPFRGIPIVTPREFLNQFQAE